MRTDLEIIELLYKKLLSVEKYLSGGVYKLQRPLNSNREDIVINSLSIASGDVQIGTYNINIHIPDLTVNIKGTIQKQPNLKRLNELNQFIRNQINNIYEKDYDIKIMWEHTMKDLEETDNHFMNIRIKFKSYQSYFNN